MPDNEQLVTFLCPVCDTPVPAGTSKCPNVNCKEDLSSFLALDSRADVYYRRALNLIRQNHHQPSEAIDLLHSAASLEPGNVDVWVVLGKLYAQSKEYASAERCWNRALSLQPMEPRAQAGLMRLRTMKQKDALVLWGARGLVLLLLLWVGIQWLFVPSKDVAQVFAENPSLAAYHLKVEQEGKSVRLIGSLPGEAEKNLVMAAAQIALPGAMIDVSGLVLAPVEIIPTALSATPTAPVPTMTPIATQAVTATTLPNATAAACRVTTGMTSGSVYLRAGGSKQFEVVGIVQEGDSLLIGGELNDLGWMPVTTSDGLAGWIYGTYCQ